MAELLVESLDVDIAVDGGAWRVLDDVSLRVGPGRAVAVVGESGAGKSTLASALLGLLPEAARVVAGRVVLAGAPELELTALDRAAWRRVRGARLGFVPQEPRAALDPLQRIGDVVADAIRAHRAVPRTAARAEARDRLFEVGLPGRDGAWPHQLSGGERQRVLIAAALAGGATVLIADEPTAALDFEARQQVWAVLQQQRLHRGLAALIVTHDLDVAEACDEVVVLAAGRVVESGAAALVLGAPRHPYTRALVAATPSRATAGTALPTLPGGGGGGPTTWPTGCRFRDRCAAAIDRCATTPALTPLGDGRLVRCVVEAAR